MFLSEIGNVTGEEPAERVEMALGQPITSRKQSHEGIIQEGKLQNHNSCTLQQAACNSNRAGRGRITEHPSNFCDPTSSQYHNSRGRGGGGERFTLKKINSGSITARCFSNPHTNNYEMSDPCVFRYIY